MARKEKLEAVKNYSKNADCIDGPGPITIGTLMKLVSEGWRESARFRRFHFGVYDLKDLELRALDGVTSHCEKCHYFSSLAEKLRPNLNIEVQELEQQRYTSAVSSKEIAAVIEAAIQELHSSVDCTEKVLCAIYGNKSNEPIRYLFSEIQKTSEECRREIKLPSEITQVIRNASWYDELRCLRNGLIHRDTGRVHLDERDGPVRYIHLGVKGSNQPFVREDIFGWLTEMEAKVNRFHDEIFRYLNSTLVDRPIG